MSPFVENQAASSDNESVLNGEHSDHSTNSLILDDVMLDRLATSLTDVTNNETCKKLSRKTKRYYKKQTDLVSHVKEFETSSSDVIDVVNSDGQDGSGRCGCACKIDCSPMLVAQITFGINFCLLAIKILAAVLSGSLSVVSSVLDSAVDLVSGILLWASSRAIKKTDFNVYPRGRGRLEPVSIVILAVIMSLASCEVIVTSVETILTYVHYDLDCNLTSEALSGNETVCGTFQNLSAIFRPCMDGATGPVMGFVTIIICCLTIGIKFVMYIICRRMSNVTIQALAQDHRNDVISNSVALSFGFMGYKLFKYVDSIGAILISLYVIITWSITAKEQIKVITGYTADSTLLNAFTWFIVRHHPDIRYVDDIRAFHQSADGFVVETDIILPPNMGLKESHDIGENLKKRLERLPEVERAFVHVDYACNKYHINPSVALNSYL